jgi:hypothetical protein
LGGGEEIFVDRDLNIDENYEEEMTRGNRKEMTQEEKR